MVKLRETPIEIGKEEFTEIGHYLINSIADFLETIRKGSVTPAESSEQLQEILGSASLPENGTSASEVMARA
ncbi:MAG: aspartate aminotransferase family protein, partial [Bacteroidia bacterium]